MREKTRRTRRVRWLAALLGAFVFALSVMPVTAWAKPGESSLNEVYVSSGGNDETGEGTQTRPVASLATAVSVAKDNGTIYVMDNLTMTAPARFWNKHLTITSFGDSPVTVSRGDFASTVHDGARQYYNGAMIEVGGTEFDQESALVVSNIIFDDCGEREGKYFVQADSDGNSETNVGGKWDEDEGSFVGGVNVDNTDIVQDAIIATYNNTATITLRDGAVLRNYGGMSAVRVSGGVLRMEAGSRIVDTQSVDRGRYGAIDGGSKTTDFGPAGAIWVQGGSITVDNGAYIGGAENNPMSGRGIYLDGGTVSMNGEIRHIKGPTEMWQGEEGVGVHARNGSTLTIGSTGTVAELTDTAKNGSGVYVLVAKLDMDGVIEDTELRHALKISQTKGDGLLTEIDGTIRGNVLRASDGGNGYCIAAENASVRIGESCVIERNNSEVSTVYVQAGTSIDFYGTIRNNTAKQCGGFHMYGSYSGGRDITVDMFDGADILDNVVQGGSDRGGAVCSGGTMGPGASWDTIFTMYGGRISGNESSNGAVFVRKNGQFNMVGGEISGNHANGVKVESNPYASGSFFVMNGGKISGNEKNGVSYIAEDANYVRISGGEICGNKEMNVDISGGEPKDDLENALVGAAVLTQERVVGVDSGAIGLDEGYADMKLGNASSTVKDQIKDMVTSETGRADWEALGIDLGTTRGDAAAIWIRPTISSPHFTFTPSSNPQYEFNGHGIYVAYVELKSDGTMADNAQLHLHELKGGDSIDVTLRDAKASTAYAVMFFNSSEYSLVPDDVTVYIGGGQGQEDNYDATGGFPDYTLTNCLDKISTLTIGGKGIGQTPDERLAALRELLQVSYTDLGGEPVKSDSEPGEYVAKLAWRDGSDPDVKVNGNDVSISDELGGRVIVRYIENVGDAQEGTNTYPVQSVAVSAPVSRVTAVIPESSAFYTNDDEDRQAPRDGVQILDDDLLIDDDGTDRQGLLEDKAEQSGLLPELGANRRYSYEFHYLDLVDAHNGNAWVSSEEGATVYLPYPSGVDGSTPGLAVIHYKDLHREYGISGQADVEAAIDACELEDMGAEFTENGIKFTVTRSGFSPFAIVWQTDAPDEPDTPVTPPSTKYYEITATAGEGGSISPSGTHSYAAGSDVTFTIAPDEGWTVGDVTVDGVSYRQLGSYTFEDLDDDHTISVTFMPGSAPADPDDTGISDWLETDEHVAYLHGYGDGSGKFGPENQMTRAEVAQMFYNLLLDKGMGDRPVAFEDVPEGAYYEGAVRVLASRGILNGTSPATFEPDRPITRAEFVAIAMRFSNGEFEGDNPYVDVPEDAWYRDYVVGATSFGWIYGYQDGSGRFGPDDTITRGQATMVTNRMLGRVADGAWIMEHLDDVRTFSDLPQGHYAFFDVVEATNAHGYERVGGTRFEDWTGLRE